MVILNTSRGNCAGTGLASRRAGVKQAKIVELLKLKETQLLFLNHPVGYPNQLPARVFRS